MVLILSVLVLFLIRVSLFQIFLVLGLLDHNSYFRVILTHKVWFFQVFSTGSKMLQWGLWTLPGLELECLLVLHIVWIVSFRSQICSHSMLDVGCRVFPWIHAAQPSANCSRGSTCTPSVKTAPLWVISPQVYLLPLPWALWNHIGCPLLHLGIAPR